MAAGVCVIIDPVFVTMLLFLYVLWKKLNGYFAKIDKVSMFSPINVQFLHKLEMLVVHFWYLPSFLYLQNPHMNRRLNKTY